MAKYLCVVVSDLSLVSAKVGQTQLVLPVCNLQHLTCMVSTYLPPSLHKLFLLGIESSLQPGLTPSPPFPTGAPPPPPPPPVSAVGGPKLATAPSGPISIDQVQLKSAAPKAAPANPSVGPFGFNPLAVSLRKTGSKFASSLPQDKAEAEPKRESIARRDSGSRGKPSPSVAQKPTRNSIRRDGSVSQGSPSLHHPSPTPAAPPPPAPGPGGAPPPPPPPPPVGFTGKNTEVIPQMDLCWKPVRVPLCVCVCVCVCACVCVRVCNCIG